MSEFALDENGRISDSDPVYDKLDKWHDSDDFDSIIGTVLAVPREEWSNKLHFRLISAYNNKKDYESAAKELEEIRGSCESPRDLAKFYYMNGYIYFMTDREMLALSMYRQGLEADPENTSGLDLDTECRECLEYINEDLNALYLSCADAAAKIAARCRENPDKIDVSDNDFTIQLGFLFAIRILPGMTHGLKLGDFFQKFEGEERQAVLKFLSGRFGITDRASLLESISKDRYCNLGIMVNDAMARLAGKPSFDPEILDRAGREAFENCTLFVRAFSEFLPRAGVLAWDIHEKMGMARYAYSCGLLPEDDYTAAMMALTDIAKERFSSAEEYLRSLVFGCAMYAFDVDCWNIGGATEFMKKMLAFLLHSDLPDMEWKKK
ncbi:MAG: DUF1266 domain-containing protein [Oscillospiraceae bacterium]|nr:DUF1266 domain-containing protein [Oscillospiraceae bacterium]